MRYSCTSLEKHSGVTITGYQRPLTAKDLFFLAGIIHGPNASIL